VTGCQHLLTLFKDRSHACSTLKLLQIGQQAALYSSARQEADLGNRVSTACQKEGTVKESDCTGVKKTHSDQAIELHKFAATMQPFT